MNISICSPFEMLLKGLEGITNQQEFGQKSCRFLEDVFERIFATVSTIAWHRTPRGLEGNREVCATVKIKNYAEEEITLPVILYITNTRHNQVACLRLGGHNGPSKCDDDPRIKELATRVFGGEYH